MPFLPPNQQRQITEGTVVTNTMNKNDKTRLFRQPFALYNSNIEMTPRHTGETYM